MTRDVVTRDVVTKDVVTRDTETEVVLPAILQSAQLRLCQHCQHSMSLMS